MGTSIVEAPPETILRKLFGNSGITDKNSESEKTSYRQDLHIGEQQRGQLGVHRDRPNAAVD
jgi:hypothetical protein